MNARKRYLLLVTALMLSGWIALGQNRNWPTYGGDAQRTGWQGADAALSPSTVKDLQLLWKIKLEVQARGMRPVMPPLILGRLISYRGFRELAFVGTNSDIVYAIDADVGTIFWQKHLEYSTREPQVTTSTWRCPGGLTAMPTMPAPARSAAGRGAPAPAAGPRGSAFIGGPASVYAISSDGRLHRLNTSTGDDITQPVSVLPANARATSLNMVDNVIYTVTTHGCNGAPDAVWAIDLNMDPPKVRSFDLKTGSNWGLGGPVLGSDGTVYVQTGDGDGDFSNSLLALLPRELQLKQSFELSGVKRYSGSVSDVINVASPVVFSAGSRDLIVSACSNTSLCLLDSAATGANNRSTPTYQTPPIVPANDLQDAAERGIVGNLASWQDTDGTRWVLASVMGPLASDFKVPLMNGSTPNGFIAAFKVRDQGGKATLEPSWVSRDLNSPLPPVIVNGVVFTVSAGEFTRKISGNLDSVDERPRGSTRATLYALDARTGKELYSSRNLITGPAALTGLSVANGRVYFGGVDGTLYGFGMYLEH
jgi:outer membrane protein assembly factor BamB